MYGGWTRDPRIARRLEEAFLSVWPDAETGREDGFCFGAHAHGPRPALRRGDDAIRTLDGDRGLYDAADVTGTSADGNVGRLRPGAAEVELVGSAIGAYPLYWTADGDRFLYSSHLRPLARAVGAEPDPLGVLSFLELGYVVGDRTFFEGVHRLRPGRSLRWTRASGRLRGARTRDVWSGGFSSAGGEGGPPAAGAASDDLWVSLRRALETGLGDADDWALMMSGGWDSRTLLAARPPGRSPPTGFSHGDVGSRELAIARDVCGRAGVEARQAEIDRRCLDPALLEELFERVELTLFPYWYRSGRALRERGAECVGAGIFGEVLGGHYGPAMVRSGWGKVAAVAKGMLGLAFQNGRRPEETDVSGVRDLLLGGRGRQRPAGLAPAFWAEITGPRERLAADVEDHLRGLADRGIAGPERLVEAFLTEHRGAQYIHGQLRSARAAVDVTAPFADPRLLGAAAALPLSARIHNRLNRRMLRRHAPELLASPMAATLVRASRPIPVQEASRAVRRAWQVGRWWAHRRWPARVGPPRLAWIDFEWIRGTDTLARLVRTLEADLWARDEIEALADRVHDAGEAWSIHPVVHRLLKMHTVDAMLR